MKNKLFTGVGGHFSGAKQCFSGAKECFSGAKRHFSRASKALLTFCLVSTQSTLAVSENKAVHPEIWPELPTAIKRSPEIEKQVKALLSRMTLEEKIGQVIQADISAVTPEEVKEFNLGSILNGGNSAPDNNNRSQPDAWLKMADEFWQASTDTSDGGVGIPIIWGTDAVHGHNNITGATVFPHNIGLGAARDPELMYRIGTVTAKEVRVTGMDWTFAPTLAVVRNDSWGRTYESYSESPEIIAQYSDELVSGLQGNLDQEDFLGANRVLATAKHFVGDGGTKDGKDQGDNISSEEELRDIHAAGYPNAILAGAQVVMASYNSWHGLKMHGYKEMLTDVLVDRMGFDGFVVGDWNGHGQVQGCSNVSCAQAFNAGLDMFMAPDSWKQLYFNLLQQVQAGVISQKRLDQAVSRILRVKLRTGVFEAGLPSKRPYAGEFELLGSAQHRSVARDAVRKSLVLLKNNDQLLPLSPTQNILVAGPAADNIGQQSGGWTLTWQGTGNANSDFPNGESIYQGFAKAVNSAGGKITLSETGEYSQKPDVAIVVFGEEPYAEFQGDRAHLDYEGEEGLALLRKFQKAGIKTVAVFISGRPMWVNPEINAADAFVAAWLPGTEGGGVADVLMTDALGYQQFDFTGRLSFSWPAMPQHTELNIGNREYQPLFPYGYGLSYNGFNYSGEKNDSMNLAFLSEDGGVQANASHVDNYLYAGDPVQPWRMLLKDSGGETQVTNSKQASSAGVLTVQARDDEAQEDTIVATWDGEASLIVRGNPIDISRQSTGDMALEITYKVLEYDSGNVSIQMGCATGCEAGFDITSTVKKAEDKGWQTGRIKLRCFQQQGADLKQITEPLHLAANGELSVQLRSAKVIPNEGGISCQF